MKLTGLIDKDKLGVTPKRRAIYHTFDATEEDISAEDFVYVEDWGIVAKVLWDLISEEVEK